MQPLPRLGKALGISLSVKRDDLFPLTGGGNKARKMTRIVDEIEYGGQDALVSVGGCQSNHARVVALIAAERGWPCRLILHGDSEVLTRPTGNLLLMQLAGAQITITKPENIEHAVAEALNDFASAGYSPYEIRSGGHCLAGGLAYSEAIDEVQAECHDQPPDWIVHASGTGSTQAGLIAGIARLGWPSRVVGISVAREAERGVREVATICSQLLSTLGLDANAGKIDFRDEWICGGYEQTNDATNSAIRFAAKTEGLMLDPTYTGKAFCALMDLVEKGEIEPGARVLFWHTGGLLNLTSAENL